LFFLFIRGADAADLVMPSKLSGILASGKAVVATAAPQSELGAVIRETGVLTSPGNVEELSAAFLALAKNPARRTALGKKGRTWVLSHWAEERVLDAFEKHLENVLKSR
jgi:colanic acid biosynthesis glycosyl transferase WcaI